jgi:hypothetical protein
LPMRRTVSVAARRTTRIVDRAFTPDSSSGATVASSRAHRRGRDPARARSLYCSELFPPAVGQRALPHHVEQFAADLRSDLSPPLTPAKPRSTRSTSPSSAAASATRSAPCPTAGVGLGKAYRAPRWRSSFRAYVALRWLSEQFPARRAAPSSAVTPHRPRRSHARAAGGSALPARVCLRSEHDGGGVRGPSKSTRGTTPSMVRFTPQ